MGQITYKERMRRVVRDLSRIASIEQPGVEFSFTITFKDTHKSAKPERKFCEDHQYNWGQEKLQSCPFCDK